MDLLLEAAVEGPPAAAPPATPEIGQCWIVAAGASGTWTGQEHHVAGWTAGGWRFLEPQPGTRVWDKAAGLWLYWNGSGWSDGSLPAVALVVAGQQVVGSRQPEVPSPSGGTTIDSEARTAVASIIVALRTHGLID